MRLRHAILGVAAAGITLTAAVVYKVFASLPAPIPPQGVILDAATGKGISGAQLNTRWRLYDYPMLDGAGSYELSSVTATDAKGHFSLAIPNHRRGLWNTATFPPTVTAAGYKPVDCDNTAAVEYVDGKSVIIRLSEGSSKPLK
jgi:hypothetical protein